MKITCQWLAKLLTFFTVFGSLSTQEQCLNQDRALIIALLALHRGNDCELVVQKGAQQIAALEKTLNRINSENDLKLDLKVFDTCSNSDEVLKWTLRAMAYAEQGCPKPPLFLGFLGPDDPESLSTVTKVSGVFKHIHVVPNAIPSYQQYNVLNVEMIDPGEKAKAIGLLLKQMNWASFFLVHTSDSCTIQVASSLIESREYCILRSVAKIPIPTFTAKDDDAYNRFLKTLLKVEKARVLVLSDTAESAENLMNSLKGVSDQTKFVIYLQGSGILPWKVTGSPPRNVILLQETTNYFMSQTDFLRCLENTTLWPKYLTQSKDYLCEQTGNQICDPFFVEIDPTVPTLAYSLHLYSEALKKAHRTKCRKRSIGANICQELLNMPPEEWRTTLENVEFISEGQKVRFYMDMDNTIDVLAYDVNESFDVVGRITNGEYLSLTDEGKLFTSSVPKYDQCFDKSYEIATSAPEKKQEVKLVKEKTPDNNVDDGYHLFGFIFDSGYTGYYELIGTLVGLAFGIVSFFGIIVYIIYRSFRVKPRSNYSDASSESHDRSRSKRKKNRKCNTSGTP